MRYRAIIIIAGVAALGGYRLAAGQDQPTCTTVLDCAQKAMEASFQAKTAIRIAVPKGAVMAFNLESCPDGWQLFQPLVGRFALGAGADVTRRLTDRKFGDSGGEEQHTLTVAESPQQEVEIAGVANQSSVDRYNAGGRNYWVITRGSEKFRTNGGGQPHNNMPPFHSLTYCERT
ncbi:hypothetical protein NKJ72_29420 [Mesorhizobium sp. M0045]|uniref:hypothetical protein n=1 Tax=Mesorhizobium sp. M0045 TaxID=2956857 RepID=UPI003336F30D